MNAIDRAQANSTSAPLTGLQRQRLVGRFMVPAHRARVRQGVTKEPFEAWRREELFKACHKTHLHDCVQADFQRIIAHFLRLCGRAKAARAVEARTACGGLAVARHKLREAMFYAKDVIGNPMEYAAAISASRFKTRRLDDLSERQLWGLTFDLRRAAQRRRKAFAAGARRGQA